MTYRSKDILTKPDWSFNRSVFKAIGYSDDDLKGPIIGIANSWNELVPGHFNLRQISEAVKRGIYRAWRNSRVLPLSIWCAKRLPAIKL